jgi:hypothetical protein
VLHHIRPPLPRISVVTPSYNQGSFLKQCIQSVLDQGYPNLEYIIIDGGSTDDSVDIIRQHQQHIAYWVSEPDGGQSAAINKGFRRATGHIVAWLNSDDFYLPCALHAIAVAYCRNPRASFFLGNGLRVDKTGAALSSFFPEDLVVFHRPALVWGLNYVLQPAAFINRSHLIQAGYVDENLRYGMDSDLWLKLSALAEPEPIQTKLAASREYGDTKTATGSFARIEELRAIGEKYSTLPITPGTLCYFLDTLQAVAKQRPDVFCGTFLADLAVFWTAVHRTFVAMNARYDGFPVPPGADPALYMEKPRSNESCAVATQPAREVAVLPEAKLAALQAPAFQPSGTLRRVARRIKRYLFPMRSR